MTSVPVGQSHSDVFVGLGHKFNRVRRIIYHCQVSLKEVHADTM